MTARGFEHARSGVDRDARSRGDPSGSDPGGSAVAAAARDTVTLVPSPSPSSSSGAGSGKLDRIPAVWLVVGGIFSVQFGAAIAKDLFDVVPPTAMVWMRLATSAVIFMLAVRPSFRGRSRTRLAGGVGLRRGTDDDELGDLPVVRGDPVGRGGDHRVPRSARCRRGRIPPAAGSDLGRAGWSGRCAARFQPGRADAQGHLVRVAGRCGLGGVHPAQQADRPALAGTVRAGDRESGRVRGAGAAGHPRGRCRCC